MIVKATAELQKIVEDELKIPDPPPRKAMAILNEAPENDTDDSGEVSP